MHKISQRRGCSCSVKVCDASCCFARVLGSSHLFWAALMQTLGKGSFGHKHLSFTSRESPVPSPMKAVRKMQSIKWNCLRAGTQLQSVHTTRCWLHLQSRTAFTVIITLNLNNLEMSDFSCSHERKFSKGFLIWTQKNPWHLKNINFASN